MRSHGRCKLHLVEVLVTNQGYQAWSGLKRIASRESTTAIRKKVPVACCMLTNPRERSLSVLCRSQIDAQLHVNTENTATRLGRDTKWAKPSWKKKVNQAAQAVCYTQRHSPSSSSPASTQSFAFKMFTPNHMYVSDFKDEQIAQMRCW